MIVLGLRMLVFRLNGIVLRLKMMALRLKIIVLRLSILVFCGARLKREVLSRGSRSETEPRLESGLIVVKMHSAPRPLAVSGVGSPKGPSRGLSGSSRVDTSPEHRLLWSIRCSEFPPHL